MSEGCFGWTWRAFFGRSRRSVNARELVLCCWRRSRREPSRPYSCPSSDLVFPYFALPSNQHHTHGSLGTRMPDPYRQLLGLLAHKARVCDPGRSQSGELNQAATLMQGYEQKPPAVPPANQQRRTCTACKASKVKCDRQAPVCGR